MAKRPLPSPEVLRQLLLYDPETGKLFWKERGPEWFNETTGRTSIDACKMWNGRFAGKEALKNDNGHGYLRGRFLYQTYFAHLAAWTIYYGEHPTQYIDHINRVRNDNRISNLRSASRSENGANRSIGSNNTSGFKGVCYIKSVNMWQSYIYKDKKQILLGRYNDPIQASAAYREAAQRIYGDFSNT